jgi:PadR family transcriptional regulator, regulatory protein PadR
MNKLTQVMAAVRRGVARLLPGGRRDWVAAVWAEAHQVPPGLARLAWRAGGVWVLAREALRPRRLGRAVLFAVAAAVAAWAAWPQPGVGHVADGRFNAIAPVLLLAGLMLLSRRFFGSASPGRVARSLRVLCCAAVPAVLPALAILLVFTRRTPTQPAYQSIWCIAQGWSSVQGCGGVPGRSSGGPTWEGEILVMLLVTRYVGVTLFLTSRWSRGTLAIGVTEGLLFGVVMFAVDPLGLDTRATDPWLPGSAADPLVALAWILLIGGPAAAAVMAARRCRGPGGARPPHDVRIGQGIAAGVLATGTAALFTTALGTGTTLLTLKSPWLLHWLNHGQHLTALATYRYELYASMGAAGYGLMLICFPVIGPIMSSVAAAIASPAPRQPGRPEADRVPFLALSGCTAFRLHVLPMQTTSIYLWGASRERSRPGFSAQTLPALAALCDQPPQWQHEYALARQTGLKSGTLYPISIRLAGRGLVEARWQDEPQPGRPRRHLYRPPAAARAATRAPGGRAAVAGLVS